MSSIDESLSHSSVDEESSSNKKNQNPWGWRREHRIGLAVIFLIILAAAVIWFLRRPQLKNDPLVIVAGEKLDLPVNIDPNTATASSLSRIPGIGEETANTIVTHRQLNKDRIEGGIVYRKLADLVSAAKIRNKKTIELCRTYMTFPDEPNPSPNNLIPPKKIGDIEQTEDDD